MSTDLRVSACGLDSTNPFSNADVTDPDCKAVVVDPLVVNTVVRLQIDTTLMGIVGVTTMKASGTGKARPYEGTNKDNAC